MNKEQLEKLLSLYKMAVEKKLTAGDFVNALQEARIEIDRSFVQTGKEDANLGEYLEELKKLQEVYNEQ
jgi:hypothetical protein